MSQGLKGLVGYLRTLDGNPGRLCQLHPLQLLAHTYMYTMDFITMHAATYWFGLLGETLCNNFQGWAYFQGWVYFREATVL